MAVSQRLTSSPIFTRMAGGRLLRAIAYWVFTIFIAWEMTLGAYWDLFQMPYVRNVFTHLHLPSYFLIIMGIWKLPCAVVLLIPGVPRMKEWAYAGAFFTYSGAAVLHLSVGDSVGGWAGPVLYALFTVASWLLRPSSRRLMATAASVRQPEKFGKIKRVFYWIVTSLMAFALISGGIAELSNSKTTIDGMLSLGYPVYFTHLLGFWKVAGGIVVLAPRLSLIKEWAYIGIFLDMSGAFMTHIACHSVTYHLVVTGVLSIFTIVSWALRPSTRKIEGSMF